MLKDNQIPQGLEAIQVGAQSGTPWGRIKRD